MISVLSPNTKYIYLLFAYPYTGLVGTKVFRSNPKTRKQTDGFVVSINVRFCVNPMHEMNVFAPRRRYFVHMQGGRIDQVE